MHNWWIWFTTSGLYECSPMQKVELVIGLFVVVLMFIGAATSEVSNGQ